MTIAVLLCTAAWAFGDTGIIIPSGEEKPNPAVLSLDEMHISVVVDNGDARVSIQQIYGSHVERILEGNYLFALPAHSLISDFAVWDGVTRIPGVILERKRASEIYDALKWQSIDPGLLQLGEQSAQEASRSAAFSARIVPIPAYGTKRVEIEYHQSIPVEDLASFFALPLHPDAYQAQIAGHLSIDFELRSAHTVRDFNVSGQAYPLNITERGPHRIKGSWEADNVGLKQDFAVRYAFDRVKADSLVALTYRNPRPPQPDAEATSIGGGQSVPEKGFFEASALIAPARPATAASDVLSPPRTLWILFDTSLSMQWEKLEQSFHALESLLHSLRPADRFNLLLFNTELNWFEKQPVAADTPNVERALQFVRAAGIRGGTDLQQALDAVLEQARSPASAVGEETYVILLSDGDATRGPISTKRLAVWYSEKWKSLPDASRPRTYAFGVGDDANLALLRLLAENHGLMESVLSTEPIEFKLNAFLGKIGQEPLSQLGLSSSPEANFDRVYPLQDIVFPGSVAAWVGQYERPLPSAQFQVMGMRNGRAVKLQANVPLPEKSLEHPELARTWAKARVDALLAKIARDGEDPASVDEIIRLARQCKFVTPYTSFLAAPRALLRPRVIRPGDPILRVKTDASIVSVIALLPFGLIKPLRHLASEDIWQTRFLAPEDMGDGTYVVRMILRDRAGHVYRESKTFVIVTKPPLVRVHLPRKQFRRGEPIPLSVRTSERTRTIVARLYGAEPAYLTWNPDAHANVGTLVIPSDLPAGPYTLTVTAEDVAHNIGTQEVTVEVVP